MPVFNQLLCTHAQNAQQLILKLSKGITIYRTLPMSPNQVDPKPMAGLSSMASPCAPSVWVVPEPRTRSPASSFCQSSSSMSLGMYLSRESLPWISKLISNDLNDISTWIADRHLKINTSETELSPDSYYFPKVALPAVFPISSSSCSSPSAWSYP